MNQSLEQLFSKWNPGTAGGSVVVRYQGKMLLNRVFGLADLEHGVPVTPSTRFNIASTSKQFACFCILLLYERGRLHPDDAARDYIPQLMPYQERITIRQLMHHTSGIRELYNLYSFGGLLHDDISTCGHIRSLARRLDTLSFAPGTQFSYCNTAYFLLGEIVTAVTGQSLRDFAQAEIFAPLGMTDTFWLDDYTEVVPNLAGCYYEDGRGNWSRGFVNSGVTGSSGIISHPGDLLKWTAHFLAPTLCRPETLALMQQPGRLSDGTVLGYGMGLYTGTTRGGLDYFEHSGSTGAFRSAMMVFPGAGLELIITANNPAIDLNAACFAIAARVTGTDCTPLQYGGISSLPAPLATAFAGDASGRYVIMDSYLLELVQWEGGYIVKTPRETLALEHVEGNHYFCPGMGYHFYLAEDHILVSAFGVTLRSDRLTDAPVPLEKARGYCGVYYCRETNGVFEITAGDGAVQLIHPRLGAFACVPLAEDRFVCLYDSLCYINFGRDHFSISASRSQNLVFTRLQPTLPKEEI